MPLEQAVYLSASALAGTARFVVLGLAVLARDRSRTAPTARPVAVTHTSAPAEAS
ncbi:hypothetical protein [Kitasatospora sp. NPDC091207]|uniref:hypothetical protein n=1 Tax=Kitasatospora sp. NPDC091207 TaxID=3364083 RepID=UPI0037F4731A